MQYTIDNGVISLTVDTLGAEPVSIKRAGTEQLWQNQTGGWSGHAPILFPFCGNCQLWVEGRHYPMNRHGFARISQFELVKKTADSLTFVLKSNDDTKKLYPFDFELIATYSICKDTLTIGYAVKNCGSAPLYYACGGHESFYLADGYANYQLIFEKQEDFTSLGHNDDGRLNGKSICYGGGLNLAIPTAGLENKKTVIFGNINSRKVTLAKADCAPVAEIEFEGFSNLLLWSPDGQNAICIEPWTNLADTDQNTQTEFCQKQGVLEVQPNQTSYLTRKIRYV